MTLSLIVPTYNEKNNILPLLQRIRHCLGTSAWEVIFVDDNSSDGTAAEAFRLSQEDDRVRMILRLSERGLARATIQGILSAKGTKICVMDGDGQHDPRYIADMIARLDSENLDIVSAARCLDAMTDQQALSGQRIALSKLGNILCNYLLGRKLSDPLTGFFVLRREAFLRVAPRLGDPGFKLLLDILHSDQTLRHAEHPFEFGTRASGESKLDAYVTWRFITFLLSKATNSVIPADLISFLLVGSTGLLVHFFVLFASLTADAGFLGAEIIATMASASSNFLLNNFLTFRDRRLRGSAMLGGYAKFLLTSSVGIAANISVAALSYERYGHRVLTATLAGLAIDSVWKFIISKKIIWK